MEDPQPTKTPDASVAAGSKSSSPQKRSGAGLARRERARLVGAGLLGVVLTVFAVLNLDSVEVNWLLGSWSTPLIVVIVVAALFGMALDRILLRRSRSKAPRR